MIVINGLPRIGAHLPIGKGLKNTANEAVSRGLEAVQIFLRNPRGRGARKLQTEEIDYFQNTIKENNIWPVVVHIPYICNPAAAKEDIYNYAYEIIIEDLKRADVINADFIVLHPGSYTDSSAAEGIERIAVLLNRVFDSYKGSTRLLLETMSGQGTEIGRNFTELNQILQKVNNNDNIGICFDTCHTFAAGYDCTSCEGLNKLISEIEKSFGKDKIQLIHANDSFKELGSHRDRHAHIGEGYIGEDGFIQLMSHKFFKTLPFILETPLEGIDADINNLKRIRSTIEKNEGGNSC